MNKENLTMILTAEKEHQESTLLSTINSLQNQLSVLEDKVRTGSPIYESDSLQGNGYTLDKSVIKIVALQSQLTRVNSLNT